jgi:hypothetical protein
MVGARYLPVLEENHPNDFRLSIRFESPAGVGEFLYNISGKVYSFPRESHSIHAGFGASACIPLP